MAILDHFECQVLVNGEPLSEYDDEDCKGGHGETISGEDASSDMSVKYIEAVAGSNFAIKCHFKPGFQFAEADHLAMKIHLDGQQNSGIVLTKDNYSKTKAKGWSGTRMGVQSGNETQGFELQRFRFGEIVTGMQVEMVPLFD